MDINAHLQKIQETCHIPKDHVAYLQKLKASGFEPAVIYDIGACVLHWTREAQRIWPAAEIVLFDAFDKAEFLYADHRYHLGVLSDTDGAEVKFFQNDLCPGGNSYYREIGHAMSSTLFPRVCARRSRLRQAADTGFRRCVASTLDTVVAERGFPLPDLVKIDVQGAERDVIQGGRACIANARHLIVEMQHTEYNLGAPKVDTTLPFIESVGFRCVAPKFSDNGCDADYAFERA